ncbi:putative toxin-antitoxin system toxin component, PIN family [Polynucleobacter sp. UK-Kesae-W10]|uniref:putative toxin-antitoxin system toxin component, PIN family n=1 Tax=Polynucleobacter sp. UK-Kesae-W10 TaxID=1819738 RepID=UPI001C0ACF94|nr:putative toxin-antitoxin system toxin component, PIN family [Polynucleobacter sp. UK-Kesae-W10]MBU3577776.1 putative toxin-antitoxin system toxin component, PIN family [Polynucleobacter sp. UK-Kesae-W10]
MKSVVFDTNVLLDIFVFNDFRAIHLKQALIEKQLNALATPKTLEEFADVISRPLFALEPVEQESRLREWQSLAHVLKDADLKLAPWQCQDPDDQVFLNLAYTARPCILISKDNALLRLAHKASQDNILITSDYNAL